MAQQKWNLGDIRPPERDAGTRPRRRRTAPQAAPQQQRVDVSNLPQEDMASTEPVRKRSRRSTGGKRTLFLALVGIVGLLALMLVVITFFTRGAELTVYPKNRTVPVQATFTAYQNPELGQLGYEMLTLEEEGERTVAATGEEEASERAAGEITIYNEYSETPQRLVKNTRFETGAGLVFRIADSVVIPGYTTDGAGAIVPGTVSVAAFADASGDTYNIGPSEFTIPGLEGTEQFDTMYGRSAQRMTGGFEGTRLIVEEGQLTEAQGAIRGELESSLRARLKNEQPAGFILYEGVARIRYESLPAMEAGEGQATVRERAILEAPIFAEADFAQYLAQNTIAGYEGDPIRIENPHTLSFTYLPATTTTSTSTADSVEFNLSGEALLVWDYDEHQLRTDLAGAAKTAQAQILPGYPAIERAEVTIRPFWKQSFPDDVEDIAIVEVIEAGE